MGTIKYIIVKCCQSGNGDKKKRNKSEAICIMCLHLTSLFVLFASFLVGLCFLLYDAEWAYYEKESNLSLFSIEKGIRSGRKIMKKTEL